MKSKSIKIGLLSVSVAGGMTFLVTGCGTTTSNASTTSSGSQANASTTSNGSTTSSGSQSSQSTSGGLSKKYSGTTITVLLPPWGQMPQSSLDEFTKQTGIKVKMESMSWDNIHQQIVTSEAAHISPADVTEVDWSWIGQFAGSGWYTPLNQYMSKKAVQNNAAASIFTVNNKLLAMPYSLDYRVVVLNMTDFKKAGITTVPKTWTDILNDAKEIKQKGVVQYPTAVPMSVTEGTSTPWYELIKSDGGELFDSNWKPMFTASSSAGAQALNFEKQLYDEKLVPPGEVSLTDVQNGDLFKAGKAAIELAASPGGMAGYSDPKVSKITQDDIVMIAPPGQSAGQSGTYGLPEGLGIPTLSKNKGAAAMFINWWMQTPQQITAYENGNMGDLPPERYALQKLNQDKKLVDGKDVMSSISSVKSLFPQGTPSWYPQFSNAVATMIQSVVEGKQSPAQALQSLAQQAKSFRSNS